MILRDSQTFHAERLGRFLRITLKVPHLTLSSCPVNGGMRQDLSFLVNHQSGEGRGGDLWMRLKPEQDEKVHHENACAELGLPPERTALLSTAANMQYAVYAEESDEDLRVTAFVTAGVRGNAARAGDSATWREDDQGRLLPVSNESSVPHGTIHIIVLYNRPLRSAALVRCAATLTEAKTAVLQELAVPSLYGSGLATGTGTDGFSLAAAEMPEIPARRWAGAHFKVGELTARAVMSALREALHWQNGMDPAITRNLFHALSRFGVREISLMESLRTVLEGDALELLLLNREALWHEPQVAAAAYALAAVLDRAAWGTLPPSSRDESVLHQSALFACAVAQSTENFSEHRLSLATSWNGFGQGIEKPLAHAIALGWRAKWKLP